MDHGFFLYQLLRLFNVSTKVMSLLEINRQRIEELSMKILTDRHRRVHLNTSMSVTI